MQRKYVCRIYLGYCLLIGVIILGLISDSSNFSLLLRSCSCTNLWWIAGSLDEPFLGGMVMPFPGETFIVHCSSSYNSTQLSHPPWHELQLRSRLYYNPILV